MELANGYTDVIDRARRRKDMNPAAEIQQSRLPPRIVRMGSGELAGGRPWQRRPRRAARRPPQRRHPRAGRPHHARDISDAGGPEFFVTATIARWHPVYSVLSWINCGHPPPLLVHADDTVEELATKPDLPLGMLEHTGRFHRHQRRLLGDDRLVLYSDGISRRRTSDGLFGTEGIVKAARAANGHSATATARAIQEAVVSASEDPLPDDAAVVVLATTPPQPTPRIHTRATADYTTSTARPEARWACKAGGRGD